MSDNLPDQASQRASDADRDRVIEILQAAAAEGRLDLDEFDERMSVAARAKTFGELAPLTADLRGMTASTSPANSNKMVIHAHGSSPRREGRWSVPPLIEIDAKMGSPVLDFTDAQLHSRDVEIAINFSMGTLKLIVPDGTSIDDNDLVTKFGATKNKVTAAADPPLRIRLTGETNFGSVVVRRPGFFRRHRS